MDNVVIKLFRAILIGMVQEQFETNPDLDSRTNLYIAEVDFIKDVVVSLTGADTENNDKLHDYVCSLVDRIHKEFNDGCNIQG